MMLSTHQYLNTHFLKDFFLWLQLSWPFHLFLNQNESTLVELALFHWKFFLLSPGRYLRNPWDILEAWPSETRQVGSAHSVLQQNSDEVMVCVSLSNEIIDFPLAGCLWSWQQLRQLTPEPHLCLVLVTGLEAPEESSVHLKVIAI